MNRPVRYVLLALALAAAGVLGFVLGRTGDSTPAPAAGGAAAREAERPAVWTCSMHPQIRLPNPGNCPICEMPLIPAGSAGAMDGEVPSLQLSPQAVAMAAVETAAVTRRPLSLDVHAVGRIEYNEASLATITPRTDGYAERLFVNFTGVEIAAGDHLAEVYSPELLVAQQELLIALESGVAGPLVTTARKKLELLGLTEAQLADLVENRRISDRVTLYSPIAGTVVEKNIVEHAAFRAGDPLYRIANLDTVWVYLDVYESELPWLRYGQHVTIAVEALPGREFEGLVTFVKPLVESATRTIRVPVHVENPEHLLVPGMFARAVIHAELGSTGRAAPTGVEGRWSCPMHPQVLADEPGACPICEMPLERIPGDGAAEAGGEPGDEAEPRYFCPMKCEGEKTYPEPGNCPVCGMRLEPAPAAPPAGAGVLAIPVTAVLDSGLRRLVYVEKAPARYEPREVVLGPRAGDHYAVLDGLAEGERVVTRGGFLIDSQFQITGHPSLLQPGGVPAASAEGAGAPPAPLPPDPHSGHGR